MKKQRRAEEAGESFDNIKNDAPESKFQKDQQIDKSTGFSSNTGSSKFTLEKKKAPGSQLKQEVASSVVRDSSLSGGSAGDGGTFAGAKSSGSFGGVAGAANATPNVGKPSRSDSRTGKKLDRNSTKLNYIPSDQVLVEWDESKPLADSADLDQGFNGTYRNEFARSQKKAENVPGALMFDRSVDLITKDRILFGQGQIVRQEGVSYHNELNKIPFVNEFGVYERPLEPNYTGGHYGNYLARNLHIKFDRTGHLIYFYFDEEDFTPVVDEHDANKSSVALKRAINRAELHRETMDTKAGDEKAELWSPLPRAVLMPTATVEFLEAMEADVGNELVTGYRKSNVAMAYQLNRAHKDGQDDTFPAIYASKGLSTNYVSRDYAASQMGSIGDLCSEAAYIAGAASTMIGLYDSPTKYNTKADFLIQPRGYRMHLQTADNNLDPFWVNKDFICAYDATEVFSTIDREYDPMGPVFMTDKLAVIHKLSWNRQGAFIKDQYAVHLTKGDARKVVTLLSKDIAAAAIALGLHVYLVYKKETVGSIAVTSNQFVATDSYEAVNGDARLYLAPSAPTYDSNTEELLTISTPSTTDGVTLSFVGATECDWAEGHHFYRVCPVAKYDYSDLRNIYTIEVKHPLLQGLVDYLEQSVGSKYYRITGGHGVTIPTVHSSQFFSLWSLLLCAAVPFIVKVRINSFRDLLYYEKNVEYPFKDSLVPMSDVKTKAYTNFGFIDRDTELEIKRMTPAAALPWILPELTQQVGIVLAESKRGTKSASVSHIRVMLPWYTNEVEFDGVSGFKDDSSAMSFPSIRSGVRFAELDSLYSMSEKDVRLCLDMVSSWKSLNPVGSLNAAYKYSAVADGQMVIGLPSNAPITARQWLTLPRQLGWFMDAPYGLLTPRYDGSCSLDDNIIGTSSVKATYWLGAGATAFDGKGQAILDAATVNINRAANFTQVWYSVLASGTNPTMDHGFTLSLNAILDEKGDPVVGASAFQPYLDPLGTSAPINMTTILSFQKALWTRIQKIPFILSPFDTKYFDPTDTDSATYSLADPFDLMYYFGLGGFRASDYRESVYNREKEIVNQGYLFVTDPWMLASPVFKEGAATGGVSQSKGFEL